MDSKVQKGNSKHVFEKQQNSKPSKPVQGFVDSNFTEDLDRRRSLTGYVFTMFNNTVSWKSNLQHIVALSTTEAKYVALAEVVKKGIWLKGFITELGVKQESVYIHRDNQSVIQLSKN